MADKHVHRPLEDLDITKDEVKSIAECLKKEEFRDLLQEYVNEVNDPENKKLYQKEITELEKERGVDVTFIDPKPGYVLKTSVDGLKKAFINICKNDNIGKPSSVSVEKDGSRGINWSLPYIQAPPRDDLDKSGKMCLVFDVVFHPDTFALAEKNAQFKNMLNETALDAVEKSFECQLDRKNLKFPKMNYKGFARATVIRRKSANPPVDKGEFSIPDSVYPYDRAEKQQPKPAKNLPSDVINNNVRDNPYTVPKYSIKYRYPFDIQDYTNDRDSKMNATVPKELAVEVLLPLLKSSADMTLDVTEKSICLVSEKPAKYKLDITLPYNVNEESGNAKFDQTERKLLITLPVRFNIKTSLADIGREDSGVESDFGRRTSEASSDEEEPKVCCLTDESASIPHIISDEGYRTSNVSEITFLNPELKYSFPAFTCNVSENLIAYTLHVKNVEPNSVEHCFMASELNGVQLKFTSLGSGFFPINYAFCIKFPQTVSIEKESFFAEAWDNNVVVQMQLKSCDNSLTEYYVGIDETSLEKYDFPDPAVFLKKLQKLEIDSDDEQPQTASLKSSNEESMLVTAKLSSKEENDAYEEDDGDDDDSTESSMTTSEQPRPSENSTAGPVQSKPMLEKCRTFSESSGDELSLSPTKKGILKHSRICRSLSESSADDYACSSSLDLVTHSGSESCIPEETAEEEREGKKTVRFNTVVSKKTYRSNCSILGQRKKNQRKVRNKKRGLERRASESENSECEAEKEREKETDENESTITLIQELNETDQSADIKKNEAIKAESSKALSPKHSPVKGKKKFRKGTAQNLTFKSDLIFDLDM